MAVVAVLASHPEYHSTSQYHVMEGQGLTYRWETDVIDNEEVLEITMTAELDE